MLVEEPISIVIPTLNVERATSTAECAEEWADWPAITMIVEDRQQRGFTHTVNRGVSEARTNYVCLLNDDVMPMTDGWLRQLRDAIHDRQNWGLVGPSGPCRTHPQKTGLPGAPYGLRVVSHLAFFCVLIKREVFNKVGTLDEDFPHYGSDTEFCWRANHAGYESVWARHVYVDHEVHDQIEPLATRAAELLVMKLRELKEAPYETIYVD
jgi:GT2 family glycosyltransferase